MCLDFCTLLKLFYEAPNFSSPWELQAENSHGLGWEESSWEPGVEGAPVAPWFRRGGWLYLAGLISVEWGEWNNSWVQNKGPINISRPQYICKTSQPCLDHMATWHTAGNSWPGGPAGVGSREWGQKGGQGLATVAGLSFLQRWTKGILLAAFKQPHYSLGQADLSVLNIYICNYNFFFLPEIINKKYGAFHFPLSCCHQGTSAYLDCRDLRRMTSEGLHKGTEKEVTMHFLMAYTIVQIHPP